MAVYIDNARHRLGRMIMCHMIADTPEELRQMALQLQLKWAWLQYPKSYREHFDVSLGKRAMALQLGAVHVTTRQLAQKLLEKRTAWQSQLDERRLP